MHKNIAFYVTIPRGEDSKEKIEQANKDLKTINPKFKLKITMGYFNSDGNHTIHFQIINSSRVGYAINDQVESSLKHHFHIERYWPNI